MVINIDGTDISGVTIDGDPVQEVTIDGDVAWTRIKTIDDFEDSNLNEYSGDKNNYFISSSYGKFGNGLRIDPPDYGRPGLFSTSGLNAYPEAGDTFEFWVKLQKTVKCHIFFGVQNVNYTGYQGYTDLADGYMVGVSDTNDVVTIGEYSGGNRTTLESQSYTPPTGSWLRGVVEWTTDGTITFNLYDDNGNLLIDISAQSTKYTNGGFGMEAGRNNTGTFGFIDRIRII